MERWAANTLRTLGLVMLAGFVLVTSLFLLLLSICAWQGGFGGGNRPDQGLGFLIAAVAVLIVGTWFIGRLARGLIKDAAPGQLAGSGASFTFGRQRRACLSAIGRSFCWPRSFSITCLMRS